MIMQHEYSDIAYSSYTVCLAEVNIILPLAFACHLVLSISILHLFKLDVHYMYSCHADKKKSTTTIITLS